MGLFRLSKRMSINILWKTSTIRFTYIISLWNHQGWCSAEKFTPKHHRGFEKLCKFVEVVWNRNNTPFKYFYKVAFLYFCAQTSSHIYAYVFSQSVTPLAEIRHKIHAEHLLIAWDSNFVTAWRFQKATTERYCISCYLSALGSLYQMHFNGRQDAVYLILCS